MDGVNVLNTYEVHPLIWLGILMTIASLLAIYAIAVIYKREDELNRIYICKKMILISFLITFIYSSIVSFITNQPRLKATIDDDVKYKELTERYEVIEREGDIYTLVEIESEGEE